MEPSTADNLLDGHEERRIISYEQAIKEMQQMPNFEPKKAFARKFITRNVYKKIIHQKPQDLAKEVDVLKDRPSDYLITLEQQVVTMDVNVLTADERDAILSDAEYSELKRKYSQGVLFRKILAALLIGMPASFIYDLNNRPCSTVEFTVLFGSLCFLELFIGWLIKRSFRSTENWQAAKRIKKRLQQQANTN